MYKIPAQTHRTEETIKRSRFIATLAHAPSEDDGKEFIRKPRNLTKRHFSSHRPYLGCQRSYYEHDCERRRDGSRGDAGLLHQRARSGDRMLHECPVYLQSRRPRTA